MLSHGRLQAQVLRAKDMASRWGMLSAAGMSGIGKQPTTLGRARFSAALSTVNSSRCNNSSCSRTSIRASCAADGWPWPVQNRIDERTQMAEELSATPYEVIIMCGPPGCGQAKFLQGMANQPDTMSVFINCSRINCSTPWDFAASLAVSVLARLTKDQEPDEVQKTLQRLVPAVGLSIMELAIAELQLSYNAAEYEAPVDPLEAAAAIKAVQEPTPLEAVDSLLSALADFCKEQHPHNTAQPRMFICAAHMLLSWASSAEHAEQLLQLRALFTYWTDDIGACRVVLGSSDFRLLSGLRTNLGLKQWHAVVLGNLTEDQARSFLVSRLRITLNKDHQHLCEPYDAEWQRIFETVGGNPEDLKRAARVYVKLNYDWDAALSALNAAGQQEVMRALSDHPGYTRQAFIAAALLLISNRGAVIQSRMEQRLGQLVSDSLGEQRAAGLAMLHAMVHGGLLHIRPYSRMARDVVLQEMEYLVTTSTPLLYHSICVNQTIQDQR